MPILCNVIILFGHNNVKNLFFLESVPAIRIPIVFILLNFQKILANKHKKMLPYKGPPFFKVEFRRFFLYVFLHNINCRF